MRHPFVTASMPVVAHARRNALTAIDEVEATQNDAKWQTGYVRTWRRLGDYERSLRLTAREAGIRPHRVTAQPGGQVPRPDAGN